MHFRRNLGFLFEFLDLEGIDLGSPKLHAIEIFNQATFHKNSVILAFIGAELAGGGTDSPPPLVRVILNPIPGRGLNCEWEFFPGMLTFLSVFQSPDLPR